MNIAKYIISWVSTYIGGIIKRWNKYSISVSILRGCIELRNIELNDDTTTFFRALFSLERATIGHVRLTVPWTALYSRSCELCFEDVVLLFKDYSQEEVVDNKGNLLDGKQNIVDFLDSLQYNCQMNTEKRRHKFLDRLKRIILQNLTIVLKNCVVRYEQMGPPSLSATIHLQYLSCITTNAMREVCFVKDDTCTFYRIVLLQGLSFILTSLDYTDFSGRSWRMIPLESIPFLLRDVIEKEVKSFGYLLNPFSAEAFGVLQFQSSNLHIEAHILVSCNKINLNFSKLKALLVMASCIASLQLYSKNENKLRPIQRPSRNTPGSCVAWWSYTTRRILSNIQGCVKETLFHWTTYQDWKCHAEEYYKHYLLTLGAPWIFGVQLNTKIYQEALGAFPIEYLIQVRQEAKFVLEQYHLTGRVFPRHYGDKVCDRGDGYKVSVVEVLKGQTSVAPLRLKTSISLVVPKLILSLKGNEMLFNLNLTEICIRLSLLDVGFHIVFSAYSIRASSEIADSNVMDILYILDESETREELMISYLRNGENKELSVLLNSLGIRYDQWIAEKLITELHILEQANLFVSYTFAVTSENSLSHPLKTQIKIRNVILGIGNFEVSVEDLIFEVSWRCARLCINEASHSPFIILTNLISSLSTMSTIFIEESHIYGVISSFYALRNEVQGVMLIYDHIMHWVQEKDTLDAAKVINGFEFFLPFFILELPGACAPFKIRHFKICMTLATPWRLRASCTTMTCDGVLSDTTMHLTIFGGTANNENSLNDVLKNSNSDILVIALFEEGHVVLEAGIAALLEFLNDLFFVVVFPAERNAPIFRNESLMSPSLEVHISCSNISFDILGESSGPWTSPFRLYCNGPESLLVELKRFPDTRMSTTLSFARCCSCSVDNLSLIFPSFSDAGVLRVVMIWQPPIALAGEEHYTTLTTSITVVERFFTAYFPAINAFLRQFSQQGSTLYRLRSLGSRLHFGLRTSHEQVYAVPFWSHRTIFKMEAKDTLMLYCPWYKKELDDLSSMTEVHIRISIPSCKVAWSFDGSKGHMLTEAFLITRLPRVMKSSYSFASTVRPGSNTLAIEIHHNVAYDAEMQREAFTLVIKGQDVSEVPQVSEAVNTTKYTPCVNSMKPFVISIEEAYHFSAIVSAVFVASLPQQVSVETYPKRERSLKLNIAPFVAYSPHAFDVACVSWEGIDVTMEKDGTFEGNIGAMSLLYDASLRETKHQDMATLWDYLHTVQNTFAVVEIMGNCDTEGNFITLKKTFEADTAMLCIGGVFVHLTEKRLPLLLHQFLDLHRFLSTDLPPLPALPQETVIAAPDKAHASLLIHLAKMHLGFTWNSLMSGVYEELHLALRAFTWRTDGALTMENGGVQLKWFNTAPPVESMGPCDLLLREASETVPLIEDVSMSTQASNVGSLCVTVSPIHMNLAFDTYLSLAELVGYHLRLELVNPVKGASEELPFVDAAGEGVLTLDSSLSFTSPLPSSGAVDVFPSFIGTESVLQSPAMSPTWQFTLELTEVTLTVAKERRLHGAGNVNSKPLCSLYLTNVVFGLVPNFVSFVLREVNLSCVRETSAVTISGVQFSSSRAAVSGHSLPEMVCVVESVVTRIFTPDLLTCFDCLVRTPVEELAELYWGTMHPSGSDSLRHAQTDSRAGAGDGSSSGGGSGKGIYRKLEVVTVDTPVWKLKSDLVLGRNGGTVLQFSSMNTNNIHVEMQGRSITIAPPWNTEAEIVMVVDAGISLTFSNGRFVLPSVLLEQFQLRRLKGLGEEALLLPFLALGECSYIRCINVRYATTERYELHCHKPPPLQRDGATGTVQSHCWKLRAGIRSFVLHLCSQREKGSVRATVVIEARMLLRGGAIERGEVDFENLSVVTRSTASTTDAATTTTTINNNSMRGCATDNVLIAPVSVHLCISEGRQFAFGVGRIVVDAMVSEVLLLSTMVREFTFFARHAASFWHSPMEQAYKLQVERVLGWKLMRARGGSHAKGGDACHRDESQSDESPHTVPAFSLAVFLPFLEVTLSNVKYPLVQLALSDIVWKENMFLTNRKTLLQSQQLFLQAYGKGRWDTVIPPRSVISLEAVRSWSRRTRTEQIELQCEGFVLHLSHLLLSKMLHVHHECSELYARMLEHAHHVGEPSSPLSSASVSNHDVTATHRFINVFDDVFYLFVGKDLEHGEIVPLPSCTAVYLTLPFNSADTVRLYLYPRHCIELNEHGCHIRNSEGLRRDMQYCHVVASQLQYGRAFGLVIDDLLVVMSCIETDGVQTGMTPLTSAYARYCLCSDTNAAPLTMTDAAAPGSRFTNASMASVREADEVGLVVVRLHSQRTLCNGIGMVIEVRQYLLGDSGETAASEDFWIVPPNAEYPLLGLCSRVELRLSLDGYVYCTSFSTLSLESGVVLTLQPIGDAASSAACHSFLPVCLFMALQRFAESGSAVIHLLPRMTVINHIGVPVKLSLWQEEGNKPERGAATAEELLQHRDASVSSNLAAAAVDGQGFVASSRWGVRSSRRRLIRIGGHRALPHRGALPICHCSYSGGLLLQLSFTQTGGETLQTKGTVEVCSSLKRRVGREPCLVRMRDSSGHSFYVQVAVLHRALVLSVGHWVINLTEYPVLLTDSFVSRRLTAGQLMHTGIPPSQGVPFLIGSHPAEFTLAFLKLALDGEWSGGIHTRVGSHGVAESPRSVGGGLTRSCNYVVQFPRVQEGRPVVLLLTPRWVFVNNTNRRLKVHFAFPVTKGRYSSKRLHAGEHTSPTPQTAATKAKAEAEAAGETTVTETQPQSFVTLRPGDHHFSCIGTTTGNMVSFQDTLEDSAPSITTFSYDDVRHTNLAEFYEVHRTASISVDSPCHAAFNLWASLRQPEVVPSVLYGSRTTTPASYLSSLQCSADSSHFGEDVAFVTGRISVTVQHIDNVLAVVINSIHATNMVIQNRARNETLAVRQKGSQRRTVIPPCQNRFFLWEDYRTDPVVLLHVIGHKGAWFEVDFSRGNCQVQRRHTSDATADVLSPFSLRACTSTSNAQHVSILFTDESVPPHASFDDAWHTSVGHTLSFPALELLWLTEERPGGEKPHALLVLRELQVQTLAAGNTHTISVMLKRVQVVDVREQAAIVLHRASPASPNAAEAVTSGGILSWFWRGEEVPQQDLQAVYTAMISASGVTRVTELSLVIAPLAVDVSDHFVVSVWHEYRGLLSLFADSGGGGTAALASTALASMCMSRRELSQGLVTRLHRSGRSLSGPTAGVTSASASTAITTAAHSNQHETHDGPALLFIDQARFSRLTVFLTFSRHKPDPLWGLVGMYTLMIPKRLRQREFSWTALTVNNSATTWGLLLAQVQHWLMDGALHQWPKVTQLGTIVDKFKGHPYKRVTLADTPTPMLSGVDKFSHDDDDDD
ncbi:putative vacuolar protein sorting-associated protein 13A isoform X4 [Trypanosoma rangeli]|uniref:Putative vacuolar protein sorting-associated protein 13A isoform X4 n=1 Tax=Trypanosoma rangeli TaxID=5698 RepID=A0A422N3R6_TRYRA|nr:putative vacuolar protein sorting-associated protein 13A isoform X4 [Trypanosoma rangeli]RNF00080.1 putative vacuolar protein sorting-associated protein 13A isoform X4 [Trypanosoma rangeli]|eukprot:RNF00080.1 putative vacuolar protein sorting-associated protein 13A isoform X4 [Trypanosoma rangeli]